MGRFWSLFIIALLCAGLTGASETTSEEYRKSIVEVKEADEGKMKGSGFIYGQEGYVITNNHVVLENGSKEDLEVRFSGEDAWVEVRIIGRDPETDLAALKLVELPEEVMGLQISNSTLQEGQEVEVLANPLEKQAFVSGEVIETDENVKVESIELQNSILVEAPVKPGSSGSPVMVPGGEVIGVISARDVGKEIGIAVSASTLKSVLPKLVSNNSSKDSVSLN